MECADLTTTPAGQSGLANGAREPSRTREIPYALRIRREVDDKRIVAARLFNQVTTGVTTIEVSVDLGENAVEHNQVEIETAGATSDAVSTSKAVTLAKSGGL